MSKIKKFFTTIISAIVLFFVKMGMTRAEVPMPRAESKIVPVYGVPTPPIGIRIINILSIGLLFLVLPILVILGITTLARIRRRKREKVSDIDKNGETIENQEIVALNKRLKKITILIIVSVVIVGIFIAIKVSSNSFGLFY